VRSQAPSPIGRAVEPVASPFPFHVVSLARFALDKRARLGRAGSAQLNSGMQIFQKYFLIGHFENAK
jgi:hypothetical protein